MKWITEAIGIILCIQGVGGLVSKIMDGHPSWFLVRHVVSDGLQGPVAVAIALVGVLVLTAGTRGRQNARS
jgi:hypothetical protein